MFVGRFYCHYTVPLNLGVCQTHFNVNNLFITQRLSIIIIRLGCCCPAIGWFTIDSIKEVASGIKLLSISVKEFP